MGKNSELMQSLGRLHSFFNSREYWGSGSVETADTADLNFLTFLAALETVGALSLTFARIPFILLPARFECPRTDYKLWMHAFAESRRGNDDLKAFMWSGYSYLQGLHPERELKTAGNGLPFLYVEEQSAQAVTAGNLPVDTTLRSVTESGLCRLHVVSHSEFWMPSAPDDLQDTEAWCDMATLNFSDRGLTELRRLQDKEDAKLQEAISGMHGRIEDYMQEILQRGHQAPPNTRTRFN